jgi:hypothetical protein
MQSVLEKIIWLFPLRFYIHYGARGGQVKENGFITLWELNGRVQKQIM